MKKYYLERNTQKTNKIKELCDDKDIIFIYKYDIVDDAIVLYFRRGDKGIKYAIKHRDLDIITDSLLLDIVSDLIKDL